MATITTKYGTKINVDGLSPAQIAKVQAITANGAYGTKATALAKQFQKVNAGKAPAPGGTVGAGATGSNLGINDKTGTVDSKVATDTLVDASAKDTAVNFDLNNPGSQTDIQGNTQDIKKNPDGTVTITQGAGGTFSAVNNAFTNAALGLGDGSRKAAQDATYNYLTRNDAVDKSRDLEDTRQLLAERGIPVNFADANSQWMKANEQINRKYQERADQANNLAITSGNAAYATDVGAVGTLGSTVTGQKPTFTSYVGATANQSQALQSALQTIPGFNAQKYATDKQYAAEMDRNAIARMAASRAPSGGSSSGGGGDIIY